MKRKFTFLIAAALMLLTMMAQPGRACGQTRTTQTAFYGFETGDAGWTATSFVTNNTAVTAHGGSKYGATNGGSSADVKYNTIVESPQSLTCYYTKTTTNTNAGSKFHIQVSSNNSTWTTVASGLGMDQVTKGTWYELTADLSSYSNVYVRVYYSGTSAVRALDDITLTYDDGQAPSTDPVISFSPASVTLGDVLVNYQASTTFTVSQSNLEDDITLTVDNGSLDINHINQDADPATVTWTYTPTSAGAISAIVTATSGETTETLAISGTAIAPVEGYDVDFEYATNMYPNWTFNNMTTYQTGSITAHGGTYYGTTGGKATASITTTSTVANPGTLTCYVSKQSGNTSSSTWYIQVSENGSTWTEVESHSATSMSQGSWAEFTADLTDYTDVYVRVYYSGSTAIRNIDDLTLTTAAPSNIFTVTYNGNGNTGGSVPTDSNEYESGAEVTVLGNTGNLVKAGYVWAGWCMNAEGTGTVYGPDYTTTFEISANTTLYAKWDAKTITNLTYSGTPTATQYAGQAFNPAGLTVTATFNDASQEDVTSQVVWTPNPLTIETTSVTGTYMGWAVVVEDITVTYAPGTQDNPYTVAQARAAIDAGTGVTNVYATGIVSEIVTPYNSQYGNISYNISTDGLTTSDQLQSYRGKSYNGANFTSDDDIQVGDIVVVYGNLKKYNDIYEFDANNQLVSLIRKVATPTFSPIAGDVAAGTEVTIACATNGATIYYTTDGTDPTTSSNVYSEPILVNAAITIKAFAWKDGSPSSDIVTAEYTIAAPVATPTFSVSEGTYNFAQSVEIECTTEGATIYYTTDGNDPTTESTEYTEAIVVNETMTIKAIGAKAGLANSEVASATYTMSIPVINASDINLAYNDTEGSIAYTLTNEVEGGVLTAERTEGDWLILGEVGEDAVALTCTANEGETDRTATVTLTYTYEMHTVNKVVTVTQAHFVIDYAELPFEFNGGKADIETTVGLTQNGLGSNYSSSPKLKFDDTGDWVILKINETPGKLTFDIKNNSFSGGTFTVQTSEDGATYTDLENYTTITGTQNEEFDNLGENVRYIKWIYTNKSSGNVGLGNIALAKALVPVATPYFSPEGGVYTEVQNVTIACETAEATIYYTTDGSDPTASSTLYEAAIPVATTTTIKAIAIKEGMSNSDIATATYTINIPAITLNSYSIEAPDAGASGTLDVTYHNITEVAAEVWFCNAAGDEQAEYEWITADINNDNNVAYTIYSNNGDARTAYFKVWAYDDYLNEVYSGLVTVTQEASVPKYAVNFTLDGGTFVPNEDFTEEIVEIEAGTYNLPSATKEGYTFDGWNDGNATYEAGVEYTVSADVDFTAQWSNAMTGTIHFCSTAGTGNMNINTSPKEGTDDIGNTWTVTTEWGQGINPYYSVSNVNCQIGSSTRPATSITFTMTLPNYATITHFEAKFGGNSGSTGTVNLYVDDTNVGTGIIPSSNVIVVENTSTADGQVLTVTITNIAKAILAYYISYTYEVNTEPYITIDDDVIEVEAAGDDDYIAIAYGNLEIEDASDFYIQFYDDEDNEIDSPSWITAEVTTQQGEDGYFVYYIIGENTGTDDRSAYFKVYALDDELNVVYSNLVTITQDAPAPTHTVYFSVNGIVDGNLTVTGSSITLPTASTLTPAGFEIYGWALENSTEAVADPYEPTDDVTLYALLQLENAPAPSENYVKVTEELTDWSGEYLIVYEDGNLAFDGSLTTLDAVNNTITVTITNNTIGANATTNASKFTIAARSEGGYSIQSASGYYIGQTSDANGLSSSTETVYENAISYDTENECVDLVSSSTHLRYNTASNQERFRYYKSTSYTNQQAIQLYKKTSEATTPTIVNVEYVSGTSSMPENIPESTCYVVEDGAVLTFTGNNEGTAANLVVQEGGQLIHTADVEATVQKGVSAYTSKSGDGWYLISSPVDGISTSAVATGTYDLFIYNEPNAYWYSSTGAAAPFNTLERAKGYLYANAANITLDFAGSMIGTETEISKTLSFEYDAYTDLKGFNLMGNPFTRNLGEGDMTVGSTAVTMYYGFDDAREEFETKTIASTPIKPGQGFFIQATEAGQQLVFNPTTPPTKDASDFKYISISAGDENFTDKAYIQFGYGNTLRKMTFGENTMVYVMNNDDDYAAARVEELAGTMPVHFVPIEDGFYTITVETKNIENLNYMHLIDNIKNTEIDLLVEPSYTFKASESDNADRFYLVFDFNNYTGVNENYTNGNFAHQIGDEIFVNGEGTLQVFDMLGRFVAGYNVNGDKRISTDAFNTGVYIFRMVGTEVKTQKIVVR